MWYLYENMTDTFENFLNDITRCFTEPDFELWRSRLILPFSIVTKNGTLVLHDIDELQRNFDLYLKAVEITKVDVIDRSIVSFEHCDDGSILGTFRTRLVRDGMLITDPYTGTALLRRIDGRSQMSSLLNARGHHEWTGIRGH